MVSQLLSGCGGAPYAVRKPKGYSVVEPGDLVQVDTLDVRPLPGVILKYFTARDVVSRWDVVEVRTRATANTTTDFSDCPPGPGCPSPYELYRWTEALSIQADFEQACQERGIQALRPSHLVLPSSTVPWKRATTHPYRGVL